MKKTLIIATMTTALLFTNSVFSSVYHMCIYNVKVKKIINKTKYNKKKKSYTQRIKFTIVGCVKSGGFHPGMCKMNINSTFTDDVLLSKRSDSLFFQPGKIVKLKYDSSSGLSRKGSYSWHNWRLIIK